MPGFSRPAGIESLTHPPHERQLPAVGRRPTGRRRRARRGRVGHHARRGREPLAQRLHRRSGLGRQRHVGEHEPARATARPPRVSAAASTLGQARLHGRDAHDDAVAALVVARARSQLAARRPPRPRRRSPRPRARACVGRRRRRSGRAPRPTRPRHATSSARCSSGAVGELRRRARPARGVVGREDRGRRRRRARGCRRSETSQISAERPVGARHELAEVVARDVLDHLAARARDGAVGQRDAHAEDEVARRRRSGGAAGRSRRWRRCRRASRRPGAERRVEREALPGLPPPRAWRSATARAGAGDDGEVALVVLDDPGELGGRELDVGRGAPRCPRRASSRRRARAPTAPPRSPRAGPRPRPRRLAGPGVSVFGLEALRQAGLLERVLAVGPGHLAAQPRRRHDLAGVDAARRGRTRSAASGRPRGPARRTSSACSASCRRRRRARR